MKTSKYILSIAILIFGIQAFAQTALKTDTFKVYGECGMCKTRIEKAAKVDGVIKAEWNKDTKVLTLVYNPLKVTTDNVQKKIAKVGHDTDKFKTEDKVYSGLPGCCQYERKK